MRFLMDTHVFLWYVGNKTLLSLKAKQIIENMDNELHLGHVCIWEMAIKFNLKKLDLDFMLPETYDFESFVKYHCYINNIDIEKIDLPEIILNSSLQLHHRDPFDRLLIAQSLIYDIPIISRDEVFDQYGIERVW